MGFSQKFSLIRKKNDSGNREFMSEFKAKIKKV
jgi:hypothetical protein